MASINQKMMIVLGIVLLVSLIIDWVPGLQIGGAEDEPIAPPPAPVLASTEPVSQPQPQVQSQPQAQVQVQVQSQPQPQPKKENVFRFTIDNIKFKVVPWGGLYQMSHLIYFENGTVRDVSPNGNYTFIDKDKNGKRTSYSVFSLKAPKQVSAARLNDNLTYYFMFPKDLQLKKNLKMLNNPDLNRLIDVFDPDSSWKPARKPVKIVRTGNSTAVLYDNYYGAPKALYAIKKGDAWSASKVTHIDTSEYDDHGKSLASELALKRYIINKKTGYSCSTEPGALEFLSDLAYVPDLHGCPYESLN